MNCKVTWISLWLGMFWAEARLRVTGIQKALPRSRPFPCHNSTLWRSENIPSSVHRLRPGDIDVIAALGDSLTAGHGAMDDNLYQIILNENRGVSWSVGGQGSWREFLTVPNLLKVMNPKLVGYSLGNGSPFSSNSQFNMAFAGACDQDLMKQAELLVSRMKSDPRVDFKNHWKLITLMIGTNDICVDVCYDYEKQNAETHRKHLDDLFHFIQDNIPRVLFNFVIMPWIPDYVTLTNPPFPTCIMQLIDCPCVFGGPMYLEKFKNSTQLTIEFRRVQQELGEIWTNRSTEDFGFVFQPTFLDARFPQKKNKKKSKDPHDYSYISADCIHYSQKLQASIANAYWNNLFETPGEKTTSWIVPHNRIFKCPTAERPFIVTGQNYYIETDDSTNSIETDSPFD